MTRTTALMAGIAAAAVAASAGSAFAGSFGLREQSSYSQGASFAGAAAPGDSISAMFWNPSAVTIAKGLTVESVSTFILPHSTLDVDPAKSPLSFFGYGDGGDVGIDAFVPSGYAAYQVNDSVYLGVSVNAPFGLATHSDTRWVGQLDHMKARVFSTAITPTVGYKINDMLSVGVGVTAEYFDVSLKRALTGGTTPPTATLSGDDWGVGFTAGLTFKPMDGTEIGLGYRSSISHKLDGDILIDYGTSTTSVPATTSLDLPETVTLGLRQRITDDFTLLGGVEWTNWSRLGVVQVKGALPQDLNFKYQDGWYFSLGGEYAWNENLTLRTGVGYEISPTQDAYRSMRLPDADRIWASIGASYKFSDALSVDAAYSHLFVDDASVDVKTASGTSVYGGTAKGNVDILSVQLRYRFGG